VHLAQPLAQLVAARIADAPLEGGDDGLARQALAGRPLDREDERKAEAAVVVGIERMQLRVFGRRAAVQSRTGLLARGFGGQGAGNCRLASQFRVSAQQRQLFVDAGRIHHRLQGALERGQAGERAGMRRARRDPGRMFVDTAQGLDKAGGLACVQRRDRGHVRSMVVRRSIIRAGAGPAHIGRRMAASSLRI
jgi:hypothetical protein